METNFARFLRFGGNSEVVLWLAAGQQAEGYIQGNASAEIDGIKAAIADFAGDILDAITNLPAKIATATRFGILLGKEALGLLTHDEMAELRQMRTDIKTQVQEAYSDRAYLNTLLLLNIAPGGLVAKLLRRRGHRGGLDDPDGLLDDLLAEAVRARRHPSDVDWDVIENPGMVWGGPIKEQGGPWEEVLHLNGGLGLRIEERARNFKTFDFHDDVNRVATSAKTLDTRALSYMDRPSRVYGQLRSYINEIDHFAESYRAGFSLTSDMIGLRRVELAVPARQQRNKLFRFGVR